MKKILITLLSCLVLSSCVDLEQLPLNSLTPETTDYDEANMRSFANGLIRELWYNNYGYNCRMQILGVGADDIITGQLSKRYAFIDELDVNSNYHDDDTKGMWLNMYKLIRQANTMINIIPTTNVEKEETRNKYIGEAYFMRAYAYFILVRYFGDIPLITDHNCLKDIYGNDDKNFIRGSVEDTYNKIIIPDLLKAIEYLPVKARTNDNSVPSRMAAKACLTDVYLTMAGWPLKKTEYYAKAKDLAHEFITESEGSGYYKLVANYEDLWKEELKGSDEEHIFALNHSTLYNMASNYGRSYYALEEGGTAWADYLADSCFYERYPDDKRKSVNFVDRFEVEGSARKIDFRNTSMRSPAIGKYRDYGTIASAQSSGITPIYRYAEVLLMYAEAQNMADGAPNALAYECLNRVRERANGSGSYEKAENMNQETFAKAVFDERGWEFFAEFKRWFHLVRTEKVYEANLYNPRVKAAIQSAGITPDNRKVYLMPLPLLELDMLPIETNPR